MIDTYNIPQLANLLNRELNEDRLIFRAQTAVKE